MRAESGDSACGAAAGWPGEGGQGGCSQRWPLSAIYRATTASPRLPVHAWPGHRPPPLGAERLGVDSLSLLWRPSHSPLYWWVACDITPGHRDWLALGAGLRFWSALNFLSPRLLEVVGGYRVRADGSAEPGVCLEGGVGAKL